MYILALRARKVNATGCSVNKCINIHLIYKNSAANGKKSAYYAASGANIAMVATGAKNRAEQYFIVYYMPAGIILRRARKLSA